MYTPRARLAALLVILLALASCGNGTTGGGNSEMDEIIRVDKEVRDLIFYDTYGDGQIDFPGDIGTVGGVCSDYAAEFYYRYPGEAYLVARDSGGNLKWLTAEMLPANTYTWQTRGENFGINSYSSPVIGGSGEYDGVLRDARTITVSTEAWTEWSHATVNNHMWCAAVADGKWYLVDPTWRDPNPNNSPIKEILPPVNIVRRQ